MNISNLLAPQTAQSDHSALWPGAQHPQQPHFQAPSALPYNLQRTVPHPSRHPPLEQSRFYTNYDYGSQWHGQQRQYQQHQYQPQPLPAAQPPYQPTAGYPQHYVQQPVISPLPQLAYYPYPQPQQQQQHFYRTPSPQDPRSAKRQRFDDPNLSGQSHHTPLRPLIE